MLVAELAETETRPVFPAATPPIIDDTCAGYHAGWDIPPITPAVHWSLLFVAVLTVLGLCGHRDVRQAVSHACISVCCYWKKHHTPLIVDSAAEDGVQMTGEKKGGNSDVLRIDTGLAGWNQDDGAVGGGYPSPPHAGNRPASGEIRGKEEGGGTYSA